MSGAILHGRPDGSPEAVPLRLYIDPGSASAEDVANILASISELSFLMAGHRIVWTVPTSARKILKDAPGVHWSTNTDDALCDLGSYGGWLLKIHDREYVVCEDGDQAKKIRTEKHLDDLAENHDWSEIPT